MNPMRVASLSAAALLCACALYTTIGAARAGPMASAEPPAADAPTAMARRGHAYLFRGFAGMIFSRGTDELAEQIEQTGLTSSVNEAVMCSAVAKEAIHDYRRDPAPIIIIGHSVGAACALTFAELLHAEKIPVSLLVTTDPARISADVPDNVERYINVYQSNSMLGGQDVKPSPGFQGHYASFDLVEHTEITHVNMEKEESIHEQLVAKILQLAATPAAKAEGGAVPIHCVVPADAALELWDSGMPVFAQPGDTLQTLATIYHVPVWSLAQINQMSNTAPLASGQRVIVPRHLVPPAVADGVIVSGQSTPKH
jgi:hypothetical protein